jgi:hypothetical protein
MVECGVGAKGERARISRMWGRVGAGAAILAGAVLLTSLSGIARAAFILQPDPVLAQVQSPAGSQTTPTPATKTKKAKKAAPKKPAVSLIGNFDLQFIYDDNILRLSDGMIFKFRKGIEPQKFAIETYDDLIVSPRFGVTLGKKLLGTRETTLRLGYIRWQYSRNDIKNNESFNIRLRQPTVGRDFVEFSYTYAPISYVKQLSDREPYEPRSTTPLVWMPFEVRRNVFILGYSRRISDRVTARLDAGRVMRFYNRPFLENDNWEWNGSGNLQVSATKSLRFAGTYGYSNATARALDTVEETRETSDDSDGSYERDLYEIGTTWTPGKLLWKVATVGIVAQYQEYYFTSNKPYYDDPLHTGRKDKVYAMEATGDSKPVYKSVRLVAGWRFSRRKSSLPASVQAEDAEEKDYTDHRFWLGASYIFQRKP